MSLLGRTFRITAKISADDLEDVANSTGIEMDAVTEQQFIDFIKRLDDDNQLLVAEFVE